MSTITWSPTTAIFENKPIGTLVCGTPGSGKTFFLLNVAANCIGMRQRVIAIDPKNDFKKLKNIYDVKVIDVNNISDGALNPFYFLDQVDSTVIITIIELLCGKLEREDIIAVTPIVQDFVARFNLSDEYVDMTDVANYLYSRDNPSAQKIGTLMKTFEDSKYGRLIFGGRDAKPLKIADDNLVISFHGMPLPDYSKAPEDYDANERFTSTVLYIITSKLLSVLSADNKIPTTLICDEAHLLYCNKAMSTIIDRFLVLGRSLNTAIMLASQGMNHFPEGIAQFISSKFMFRSSIDEAKTFIDVFDVNKADSALSLHEDSVANGIANLETGWCFFIDSRAKNAFMHVTCNYDIKLLTSNPIEKGRDDE